LPRALTILSRILIEKGLYNAANLTCQEALFCYRSQNQNVDMKNEINGAKR
jgi:hypothetical protein